MLKKFATLTLAAAFLSVLPAHAQTSVALSALGSFPSSTSSSNGSQSGSDQGGLMLELRHISNPLVGYDVSYSYRKANMAFYGPIPYCPAGSGPCITPSQAVHADAQQLTLNWVVSFPILNLRPFLLAGGGFQRFSPNGSQTGGTQGQTKAVFDYGGGVDWTLLPHLGLRFQYRGNVYKAPQLATAFSSTDQFMQDAQPMIGAYFNF